MGISIAFILFLEYIHTLRMHKYHIKIKNKEWIHKTVILFRLKMVYY